MEEKKGWFGERPLLHDTILIILLSLPFMSPLFNSHWIMVGESIDQIIRLIEIDRGIREGIIYPRWLGDLAGGFGAPYFVFYAPLIYYVSEAFHFLGFGMLTSLKCMMFLGVVLSGLGMFLLTRSFWGREGALVSAVAYMYVPYRMVNLYIRGDFAEAFAMAVLPFILYFFHQLVTKPGSLYLIGSVISYAALIFTHNCTALIFSGFLFFFLAFLSLQNRSWKSFFKGLLAVTWALGLSAIFWIPALLEKKWVNIHLIYSHFVLDFHNNFIEISRLLSPTWSFEEASGGQGLPLQIGWLHILLAFSSMYYLMRLDRVEKRDVIQLGQFAFLCTFLAFFLTNAGSILLWETLPLMKYLQFPWRFLAVLALFISIISGGLFVYFAEAPKLPRKMFQVVLLLIIIMTSIQYCRVKGYYVMAEPLTPALVRKQGGTVSAYNREKMDKIMDYGEYLPKTVSRLPDKKVAGTVYVSQGSAEIKDLRRGIQTYRFTVLAHRDSEIVVGSFYYPTWQGRRNDQSLKLFTDDEGLIHFTLQKGKHNIAVFFGETGVREIVKYISLLALLCLLGTPFLFRMKGLRKM